MDKIKNGKRLLSNVIRHAHSHNKVQEERLMWQQRESELARGSVSSDWRDRLTTRRAEPLVSGRLVSDQGSSGQKYDSLDSIPVDSETDSQYWTRQLMKAEESDPFRWGHSGYKEQNPEEFVSSNDDEAYSEDTQKKCRKRKRSKKHRSPTIPSKKRKHKRTHEGENSDSDVLEKVVLESKKHKKHHKRDHESKKYLEDRTKHTHKLKTKD